MDATGSISIRVSDTTLRAMLPSEILCRHRMRGSALSAVNFSRGKVIAFPLPDPGSRRVDVVDNGPEKPPASPVRLTMKSHQFPRTARKVTRACCAVIRSCRREHPKLTMNQFLQELSDHMTELGLDPETADSYISTSIIHFDDARDASPFEKALDALRGDDARVELAEDLAYLSNSIRSQYQELATFVFHLGRFSEKNPFLSCIDAGRVLDVSKVTANNHLKAMAKLNILKITREWKRGQARELTLGSMTTVPPSLGVYTRHKKQEAENKNKDPRRNIQQTAGGGEEPSVYESHLDPGSCQERSATHSQESHSEDSLTVQCDGYKKDFQSTQVVENQDDAQLYPQCREHLSTPSLTPEKRTLQRLRSLYKAAEVDDRDAELELARALAELLEAPRKVEVAQILEDFRQLGVKTVIDEAVCVIHGGNARSKMAVFRNRMKKLST